ncbi:hypothetical protein Poli38472_003524 [Pythium oligandrum]|uniref:GDP-Man:Man(3)GlcNAc(2)-PP-Dol alpha-1,2-mannosyltransferase n=1 Tax=Pythium oligandrum TaxID=41045 RepID=A0A8K1FE52_PYTOL|nr:hypothetical protein Poli38472_003524 [Pythium oligandrum]|eukprot:TMW57599.1 hypothetical protein Poli38472_003524 [Pythium oligandrum]
MLLLVSLLATAYPLFLLGLLVLYVSKKRRIYAHHRRLGRTAEATSDGRMLTIGIFHPYANGGGGGERVLYCALAALVKRMKQQSTAKTLRLVLYTGDDGLDAATLIERSAERFNLPELRALRVDSFLKIVTLTKRAILEPSQYPRFTLFWQSVAHIRLALEAFAAGEKMGLYPEVWMDTTGCPFSYVVAKGLYACRVVAYVHYPMISTDMISKVQERTTGFNNNSAIAASTSRSYVKYIYYRLFAGAYGVLGRTCTDVVMVNSTWTYNHIKTLWSGSPIIVYPPCGTMEEFMAFDVQSREPLALSISQFRPEKNQLLQLQAFKVLLTKYRTQVQQLCPNLKLVMLGSCRNADDEERVVALKEQCADLGLTQSVNFVVNASFAELKKYLARSSIGLHTMYNEHFGISVVEMMAAGLAVIANNSGGPSADIVKPGTGFLALTADEYAEKMLEILQLTAEEREQLRIRARESSHRFSDDEFAKQLITALEPVLQL